MAAGEAIVTDVATRAPRWPRARRRLELTAALWAIVVANGAVIVWLWLHGGGVGGVHTTADLLTSLGRITGLLGVYLSLIQILLLSRLPPLERLVGFDRLSVWHRRNGKICIYLVVAHTLLITFGYAGSDKISFPSEYSRLLSGYPGMITATIGTSMMVAIVVSSLIIVRRRLPYEAWYALHFTIYGAIALAYLHQLPTGNEFTANASQADYWIALYAVTLALLLTFRVARPLYRASRHRLRVESVTRESPDVISIWIRGRHLEELQIQPGQFMLWRFLTRGRWWQSHPFSISALPGDDRLRLTIKQLGGFTRELGSLTTGAHLLAEGPFGRFTTALRERQGVALIAGGIGITPIRALLEELAGSAPVLIYRVMNEQELVLREELEQLIAELGGEIHYVVGDHRDPGSAGLLSASHLGELVPDITRRDVYVCGPLGLMHALEHNLRAAGVPRRQIHSERFALAL
jgi:predicted ferric reductase